WFLMPWFLPFTGVIQHCGFVCIFFIAALLRFAGWIHFVTGVGLLSVIVVNWCVRFMKNRSMSGFIGERSELDLGASCLGSLVDGRTAWASRLKTSRLSFGRLGWCWLLVGLLVVLRSLHDCLLASRSPRKLPR